MLLVTHYANALDFAVAMRYADVQYGFIVCWRRPDNEESLDAIGVTIADLQHTY